jgi:hypothetical protein
MTIDTKQLRADVAGFNGRFFWDAECADLAYIAKFCDDRQCDCPRRRNPDGDQDCSVPIGGVGGVDETVGEPVARMLNAVGPLLDEVERLRELIDPFYEHADEHKSEVIASLGTAIGKQGELVATLQEQLAAMTAARNEACRESDRLRHGNTIEGDFVCPNELALTNARAERERMRLLAIEVADHHLDYCDCAHVRPCEDRIGEIRDAAIDAATKEQS